MLRGTKKAFNNKAYLFFFCEVITKDIYLQKLLTAYIWPIRNPKVGGLTTRVFVYCDDKNHKLNIKEKEKKVFGESISSVSCDDKNQNISQSGDIGIVICKIG